MTEYFFGLVIIILFIVMLTVVLTENILPIDKIRDKFKRKDDLDKEIDSIEKELKYLKDKKEKLQELESLKTEMESLLGYPIEKESVEVVAKRLNKQAHIFNDTMMTSDEASELAEIMIKCGGGKQ